MLLSEILISAPFKKLGKRHAHAGLGATVIATSMLLSILCSGCAIPFREGPVPKSVVSARQLSQRGITAMQRGDWTNAETLLSEATQTCPADSDARRQYAEVLWHRGMKQDALKQLDESIRLSGDDPSLFVRQGEMFLELGRTDDAVRRADQAIRLDSKSAAAWSLRGQAEQASADSSQALADFQRALSLRHDDRAALLQTAETYRQQNKPQRALVALQILIDTYPPGDEPQQVLHLQGLALSTLGRYDDAIESLTLATQRGAPTTELRYRLAEAHLAAGHLEAAQAETEQALLLDPNHAPSRAIRERIAGLPKPATLR